MPSPPDPLPQDRGPGGRFQEEEEARRLLTTANILLRRGQTAEAERAAQEALGKRPADAGAHELLGDIRLAQGAFDDARAAYKEALTREPGRATAEAKLARAILRQSEDQRRASLGVAYAASGASLMGSAGEDDRGRRTRQAVFTALLPGLGQIIGGEFVKGGIIAGVYCLGWLLFSLTAGRSTLTALGQPARLNIGALGGLPLFALLLLTADWLYAVVDSAVLSGRKHSK